MKRDELIDAINKKLKDAPDGEILHVLLPKQSKKHGITSDEVGGHTVQLTHLDPEHHFRIGRHTARGMVIMK